MLHIIIPPPVYIICNTFLFPFNLKYNLTMSKKTVQLYASDNVLEEFYRGLIESNPRPTTRVHIPKSDVFYIREAIKCNTGVQYTLDHVERALYLEGWLSRHEVLDPNREREYG